jgi:hypothetical protein
MMVISLACLPFESLLLPPYHFGCGLLVVYIACDFRLMCLSVASFALFCFLASA